MILRWTTAAVCTLGLSIPQFAHAQTDVHVLTPDGSARTYTALMIGATLGIGTWAWFHRPGHRAQSAKEQAADEIAYLARPQDLDRLAALTTDEAVEAFLVEFWAPRDPFPETAANEAREQYTHRFADATRCFREARRPGWRTDRGRVYLLYGPPEEIERPDHLTEVWLYGAIPTTPEPDNRLSRLNPGRTKFVFTDPTQLGFWRQVYSTVPGEVGEPVGGNLLPGAFR